jgi:anaerobic carbon-monoxide dehydrogenase iron sulfur subunit
MEGKVLVVDQEKCTGCRQCEMVCSVFHNGVSNPSRSRISVIKWENVGFYLPLTCQHCEEAACMSVCPKSAISRDAKLDRVMVNYDLCIGCKMCVMACPFGAMGIDTKARKIMKCDYCDGDPQCAAFCETKAIDYVDADKVNKNKKREVSLKFSELIRQVKAYATIRMKQSA